MIGDSPAGSAVPEGSPYWDGIAGEWSRGRDELWRRHSDAVNAALCRRWLPSRVPRLLKTDAFDEACSDGLWPALSQLADVVEAIDLSSVVARSASRRHPGLSVAAADVRALPFASDAFDAVVSNSTLDHFTDVEAIGESLLELCRVLRPRGRLLLTLDNPANPVIAARNALPFAWVKRLGLVPYFVGATLGPGPLERVLRDCGFDVVEVTAILHCPRVCAVPAARLVSRMTARPDVQAGFLRMLGRFEAAARWPSRFRTGHFVAALATRRS